MTSLDQRSPLDFRGEKETFLEAVLVRRGLAELVDRAGRADIPSFEWDHKTHQFNLVIPITEEKFNRSLSLCAPSGVTVTRTRITDGDLNGIPALLIGAKIEPLAGRYFSAYALSKALDEQPKLGEFARVVFNDLYHPGDCHAAPFPAGALNPMI